MICYFDSLEVLEIESGLRKIQSNEMQMITITRELSKTETKTFYLIIEIQSIWVMYFL